RSDRDWSSDVCSSDLRRNLQPTRESKSVKPAVVALNDGGEQAQFVAQRILELRDENVDLNDIAVLYRAHYHAIELQLELSRRGRSEERRVGKEGISRV